jgi:hypothetical protein
MRLISLRVGKLELYIDKDMGRDMDKEADTGTDKGFRNRHGYWNWT